MIGGKQLAAKTAASHRAAFKHPERDVCDSSQKFHTDDVNLVQNPDELYDWSNEIYLIYYANPSWRKERMFDHVYLGCFSQVH